MSEIINVDYNVHNLFPTPIHCLKVNDFETKKQNSKLQTSTTLAPHLEKKLPPLRILKRCVPVISRSRLREQRRELPNLLPHGRKSLLTL